MKFSQKEKNKILYNAPLILHSKIEATATNKWLHTRGSTPIETLYGDVPPKWVGF